MNKLIIVQIKRNNRVKEYRFYDELKARSFAKEVWLKFWQKNNESFFITDLGWEFYRDTTLSIPVFTKWQSDKTRIIYYTEG